MTNAMALIEVSRQFGGYFVLSVQVASVLRDLYDRNGAETISGLCGSPRATASKVSICASWTRARYSRGRRPEGTWPRPSRRRPARSSRSASRSDSALLPAASEAIRLHSVSASLAPAA